MDSKLGTVNRAPKLVHNIVTIIVIIIIVITVIFIVIIIVIVIMPFCGAQFLDPKLCMGFHWDNGKENGNYYSILGLYWCYIL